MTNALAIPQEERHRLVINAAIEMAKLHSDPAAPYLAMRWPIKPFKYAFPDIQSASVWGSAADVWAVAMAGGVIVATGRDMAANYDHSPRETEQSGRIEGSKGQGKNVRSDVRKSAAGYKKNMSAREVVDNYLKSHPADVHIGLDALVKKINKATKRKVGRTTVNEVQRTYKRTSKQKNVDAQPLDQSSN